MRVIRTELYFGEDAIKSEVRRPRFAPMRSPEKNDGLAFLWFKSDAAGPYDIGKDSWFHGGDLDVADIRPALNFLLQDIDGQEIGGLLKILERSKNDSLIDFILNQDIIIEQSPPKGIKFNELIKHSNAVLMLGAYIGRSLAGDNPALLILTVPGGIIMVGSALGVADAMADGLHRHVKRLFDRK